MFAGNMFSAADAFPDETPNQQRHTPVGDSHFSDTEDDDSDDDPASRISDIDEGGEVGAPEASEGAAVPAVGGADMAIDARSDTEGAVVLGRIAMGYGRQSPRSCHHGDCRLRRR